MYYSSLSCNKDELIEEVSPKKQNTDVSIDSAQRVALSFSKTDDFIGKPNKNEFPYARKSSPFLGFEEKDIDEVIIIPDEKESPAMYIINFSPNGYIIVSATMKESPILGFSVDSKFQFEVIPLGLAEWLVGRMEKIQTLKYKEGLEIPLEVSQEWSFWWDEEEFGGEEEEEEEEEITVIREWETQTQVGPLLQTLWGQGTGYNDLVNDGNLNCGGNGNAPTGCVATAVAQVMRFHQHPSRYNWAIMPNAIALGDNQSNATLEVAELMRDIGDAVGMNYACGGSGAYVSNARNALINTFGYSNSANYVDYNLNTVLSELNSNRPIIMDGLDMIISPYLMALISSIRKK